MSKQGGASSLGIRHWIGIMIVLITLGVLVVENV